MARAYNFSAGPSCLPLPVLERAAAEMTECGASGQSVMEMSHRSPEFEEIIHGCEALLRELMGIGDEYAVLFLQGGAWLQFSMVPMNLLTGSGSADFVLTGQWAVKAFEEAGRFGRARAVASSQDGNFSYIPRLDSAEFDPGADYFHICMNNTIYGTRFSKLPKTGAVPLVADVSSCILSEPLEVSRFGLLYAGAQKNLSCAGLTLVIVRRELLGRAGAGTPTMMSYKTHADNGSMFNTPPCYAIYIARLVLEWIKAGGGLMSMKHYNETKAALLYDFIDNSRLFEAVVPKREDRSLMNVCFTTGEKALDADFVAGAKKQGLLNLKGHRAVGGIRASIYNAMPLEGVEALVEYMKQYEVRN